MEVSVWGGLRRKSSAITYVLFLPQVNAVIYRKIILWSILVQGIAQWCSLRKTVSCTSTCDCTANTRRCHALVHVTVQQTQDAANGHGYFSILTGPSCLLSLFRTVVINCTTCKMKHHSTSHFLFMRGFDIQ